MGKFFQHLGLSEWPFSVVPRPEFCTFLAGRSQLRDDVAFLVRTLSRRDTSSIHVFWSSLGAGKTHALYYLANEARRAAGDGAPVQLHPVFTEFPKGATSFVDVYRSLIPPLGVGAIADAFMQASTESGSTTYDHLQATAPDLAACLRVLGIERDAQKRSTAVRWLRADKLPVGEFRKIGISQRIETTEQATSVLAKLIRLLTEAARIRGHQGLRVIWLLDEFQRLERTGRGVVPDVNAGLHSLFNACPVGLTQVISFSGAPREKSLPGCFSPELRDRIGTTKVMVLPPCQRHEAVSFVQDIIGHFRLDGAAVPSPFFPFSEASARHIVDYLAARAEVKPRNIMHIFNAVLETAEGMIQDQRIREITPQVAAEVLKDYVVLTDEDAEG